MDVLLSRLSDLGEKLQLKELEVGELRTTLADYEGIIAGLEEEAQGESGGPQQYY